jgi:hypothetical protein
MSDIKPTVGRKLWLFIDHESPRQSFMEGVTVGDPAQPMDASIAFVADKKGTDHHYVTVTFADHAGVLWAASVPLRENGQPQPNARTWCEWPAIQGAKKSEPPADFLSIAPLPTRLTPADIDAVIVDRKFHRLPDSTITVCVLTLKNGAKEIGYNFGSINPAGFSAAMGEDEAYKMAREKVWALEGYLLRSQIAHAKQQGVS